MSHALRLTIATPAILVSSPKTKKLTFLIATVMTVSTMVIAPVTTVRGPTGEDGTGHAECLKHHDITNAPLQGRTCSHHRNSLPCVS